MRSKDFSNLICPATGEALSVEISPETGNPLRLVSSSGRAYVVSEGLPVLLADSRSERDSQSIVCNQDYYRSVGREYEAGMDWLFRSFHADEEQVRDDLIGRLRIGAGSRVIETGSGTGRDVVNIARRIGKSGRFYATDLSVEMLRLGLQRLEDSGALEEVEGEVTFLVCDATALPFPDNHFDAAFHFGGINLYSNIARGLAEMVRVVKPGGRVVVGDEGLAPWLRSTEFGEVLINSNPLYRHTAPVEHLPIEADEVCLRWILGGAFYAIDFVVREGPPKLDLDLPIPGHRGGTHRSRYYGKLEGIDPEIRDSARTAARAAGVSFKEWIERAIRSNLPD